MNKKSLTLLTITAFLFLLVMLPAAENFSYSTNLHLAPIRVQAGSNVQDEARHVVRCPAPSDAVQSQFAAPLLDGTQIFQDEGLAKLTISPSLEVASGTACTISSLIAGS